MNNLNPTLWRTCRTLAGAKRIQLLRAMHDQPGLSVSELAKIIGVGCSDASQELRRLQSRGLLKSDRQGTCVVYRMEPDPQVASAAPLLKALKASMAATPPAKDDEMCNIAFGLAYSRRIAIANALIAGPQKEAALCVALHLSPFAVFNHVRIMKECGWVKRANSLLEFTVADHPLAAALARLLKTG